MLHFSPRGLFETVFSYIKTPEKEKSRWSQWVATVPVPIKFVFSCQIQNHGRSKRRKLQDNESYS